ncbi:MAG: hypothetical protein IPL59_17710 [Candidatus Competibacteraceae bacterium]|nr:hypothetical protein [Candidatus Competibacteraceae bacterium]
MAERLHRLGIRTAEDAAAPCRYAIRIAAAPPYQLIASRRGSADRSRDHRCRSDGAQAYVYLATCATAPASLLCAFSISARLCTTVQPARRLARCFGEVRSGYLGVLEIIHPECRRIGGEETAVADCLTPIYPATAGLQQFTLRGLVEQALMQLDTAALLPELLPLALRAQLKLLPMAESSTVAAPTADGCGAG